MLPRNLFRQQWRIDLLEWRRNQRGPPCPLASALQFGALKILLISWLIQNVVFIPFRISSLSVLDRNVENLALTLSDTPPLPSSLMAWMTSRLLFDSPQISLLVECLKIFLLSWQERTMIVPVKKKRFVLTLVPPSGPNNGGVYSVNVIRPSLL